MVNFIKTLIGRFEVRQLPWGLMCGAILLILTGSLFITSAASQHLGYRHLCFGALGALAFVLVSFVDYRHLAGISIWFYTGGLAILALLPFFGKTVNNATRWYAVGPINFQPSEPMKYATILILATYFTYRTRLDRLRDLAIPLVLTFAPMFFVVQQPDLGTSLLFVPLFFGLAFVAGVPVRNLIILIAIGLAFAVTTWFTPGLIKDYQRKRLVSFVDPQVAPHSAASYNARQATLAIAGGGLSGQGWGEGLLNQLKRIPERHTDFIFPVIAEEWGFVRSAPLILFYMIMTILIGRQAWITPDPYARMLVSGVLIMFGFQSMLHMAISLRLSPITGLTLPLISYGGSSMISTMMGLGLVASAAMRKRLFFPDRRNLTT